MIRPSLLPILAALCAAILPAQEQTPYSWSSTHYQVETAESVKLSTEIAEKMEAGLIFFNDYFHFDLPKLQVKLRVRIFSDREAYDLFLRNLIRETRTDFVFISYSDPARSFLAGYEKEGQDLDSSLLHYGFIQFLNAFIPFAPLWIEEGMATYLDNSEYVASRKSFTWRPNFDWLEVLKAMLGGTGSAPKMDIENLLTIDKREAQGQIESFYPTAWGLVHFLLNTDTKSINRIFWDSISALQADSDLEGNSLRVKQRAFSWIPPSDLQPAFEQYILSLMTFNELARQGAEAYNAAKLEEAQWNFQMAIELQPESHIPYYYLGLIAYQRKSYGEAADYYSRALERGTDAGLIHYALGVNAFARGQYDQAADYLRKARELDPQAYREKADLLLKRIEALR